MKASELNAKELKAHCARYGVRSLLTVGNDAKTVKGEKQGFLTGILYMLPNDKLCPASKMAGCREACLVTAGRAAMFESIGIARKNRTRLFEESKPLFFALLRREIDALIRKAKREGLTPVVRLNGTSDVNWSRELIDGKVIFELYPDVQFYDYTKRLKMIDGIKYDNYHLTLSYSGANSRYAGDVLQKVADTGINATVVFKGELPEKWKGFEVINGDESDLRFLDKRGVIVGLKAKGKAKKDNSGFVVNVNSSLIASA